MKKLHALPLSDVVQYQTSERAHVGMPASHVVLPDGVMSLFTPHANEPSDAKGVPW